MKMYWVGRGGRGGREGGREEVEETDHSLLSGK